MTKRMTTEDREILENYSASKAYSGMHVEPVGYQDVAGVVSDELSGLLAKDVLEAEQVRTEILKAIELSLATGDLSVLNELEAQVAAVEELLEIKSSKAALRAALAVARAAVRVGVIAGS